MATLTKKNETVVAPFYKNGVTLQFITLTFPSSDLTAMLDTDTTGYPSTSRSPIAVALEAVTQVASVELIGTPQYNLGSSGNTILPIAVAALGGAFGTSKWDGTNSETFVLYCQRLIRAQGTWQGFDLNTTTVAAGVNGTTF
jgi:hypothetical protein